MKTFQGQGKNEKVFYFGKENLIHFLFRNLGYIFVYTFTIGLLSFIIYFFSDSLLISILIFILLVLFGIYLLYIFYSKTYIIVTNKRIMKFVRNGLFSEHMKELKIDQLNEISSRKKGILQKILSIGNIKIVGKDKESVIWFQGVSYPKEVALYISRLRDFVQENPDYKVEDILEFKPRKYRNSSV